jgi:hypothetical protein
MDWMIGFIDHLHTPLRTTNNYSAVADLHTLRFTITHTLGFSVFTSLILATDFNTVIIPVLLYLQYTQSSANFKTLLRFTLPPVQ